MILSLRSEEVSEDKLLHLLLDPLDSAACDEGYEPGGGLTQEPTFRFTMSDNSVPLPKTQDFLALSQVCLPKNAILAKFRGP